MKKAKIDMSGYEQALRAQTAARQAADNLEKNFRANLETENLTSVTPGADATGMTQDPQRRRRNQGTGLASQLGIAV